MNIRFNELNLSFNNLLVINGANKSGKSKILKTIERGLNGELEEFYVNNSRVIKGDFKTIYIGDYNNFSTDFKLTKSNIFKKLIYDDVLNTMNSEDMLKRILRVTSDHNREYGITLDNNEKLKDGDILYNEDKKLIVVKANSEDVLIIKPSSITEMGVIAHALGNRHLQAQFEDDKMIIQYDRLVEEELKRDNVNYSRENITLKKAFKHVEFAHTH